MQSKPTRAKRRADVLFTTNEEGPQTASYIAYCLNYSGATVARDLRWLEANGYTNSSSGLWVATDKGRECLRKT